MYTNKNDMKTLSKEILEFFDGSKCMFDNVEIASERKSIKYVARQFRKRFINGKDSVVRYRQMSDIHNTFIYLVNEVMDNPDDYDFQLLSDDAPYRNNSWLSVEALQMESYTFYSDVDEVPKNLTKDKEQAGIKGVLLTLVMHEVQSYPAIWPAVYQWRKAKPGRKRLAKIYQHFFMFKRTIYTDEQNRFVCWEGPTLLGRLLLSIFTIISYVLSIVFLTIVIFIVAYRDSDMAPKELFESIVNFLNDFYKDFIDMSFRIPHIGGFVSVSIEPEDTLNNQKKKAKTFLKERAHKKYNTHKVNLKKKH